MSPDDSTRTETDPHGEQSRAPSLEQMLYPLAGRVSRWFAGAAAALCPLALYIALFVLPSDLAHGEHYRILLIHIPAAWMAIFIYFTMAAAVALGHVLGHRLFSMVASALAPTGAMFAFLALWTGSLWGKPIWGVWWVWDTHLTSALLLLVLFLGFVVLQMTFQNARRADRAAGVLTLAGLVVLPSVYFTVAGWELPYDTSLASSVSPDLMDTVHAAILVMTAGLAAYAVAATLTRLRIVILERDRHRAWVLRLAGESS